MDLSSKKTNCLSLPFQGGFCFQILTLSTNGGMQYRVSAYRFKKHRTLLCAHRLLTEGRDRANLISVLRFISKIKIYYVREVHLTALLPLCYQSYSTSGTDFFFFFLKNQTHSASRASTVKKNSTLDLSVSC